MKAYEDDHGKLKHSLPDMEIVEVTQYRCDVVELPGAGQTTRAAEFCTMWSLFSRPSPVPYTELLQLQAIVDGCFDQCFNCV